MDENTYIHQTDEPVFNKFSPNDVKIIADPPPATGRGGRPVRGAQPMTTAALYIRVSTGEQKTDMQRADLHGYAERRGFTIFKVYDETASGAATTRPAFNQLMQDARKRRFDIVLVWKFDRFARSLKMLVEHLELFRELGIDFISYQENIDTTTSIGRLVFQINAAYAEFERGIIRERVKAGVNAKRAKTGQWGRRELDYTTRKKITAMRAAKTPIRTIARQLHISPNTVRKYSEGYGQ